MSANAKKIILSGYYGFANAGDEAVLAALCQILQERLPQAQLVVLSAQPEQTAAALGVRAINRWDKAALRAELQGAALFCSGGGSLLQDVTSVRSVWYYTSLLRLAQKQGVPTIVLAQGLGPLNTGLGRWLTRRALSRCRLLSWRDAASLQLAAEIMQNGRADDDAAGDSLPSYQVCDPVLLWRPELPEATADSADPAGGDSAGGGLTVALALRPWPGLTPDAAAQLVQLLQQAGCRVALLPYHQGEDEKLAEQINAALLAAGQAQAAVWPAATPQQAWAAVGRADLLLGMRLHSLIMAAAQGVPAVAVSYDPKVEAFAQAVQMPLAAGGVSLPAEQVAAQLLARANQTQRLAYPLGPLLASWQPLLAAICRIVDGK